MDEVAMKDHNYFVYIVCSRSGTLYIGITNSIYRRALEHKRGEVEGFAGKYGCDQLVYYESFDDVHKSDWTRETTEGLVESEEDRLDRVEESTMGRFCRKVGCTNALCRRSDEGQMRIH